MSESRKLMEGSLSLSLKLGKIFGWILIILGIVLCLTVVGIGVGIACIIIGGIMVYVIKRMTPQIKSATAEHFDVMDNQIQQARSQKNTKGDA